MNGFIPYCKHLVWLTPEPIVFSSEQPIAPILILSHHINPSSSLFVAFSLRIKITMADTPQIHSRGSHFGSLIFFCFQDETNEQTQRQHSQDHQKVSATSTSFLSNIQNEAGVYLMRNNLDNHQSISGQESQMCKLELPLSRMCMFLLHGRKTRAPVENLQRKTRAGIEPTTLIWQS